MEQIYRIGLDHGYGNIKTAHHVFRSVVIQLDTPPTYGQNVLEYDSHYYLIGDTHKEFVVG